MRHRRKGPSPGSPLCCDRRHTSFSRTLAENALIRNAFAFTIEENLSASARATDALQKHPASEEPTLSGWGLMHQAKQPMFQELQKHYPIRHAAASTAMDSWDSFIPPAPLLHNYRWEDVKTFVDIGGGRGPVSIALARLSLATKFVVQELEVPSNVQLPADVQDRVTFMAHDMFQPQPVKDADVYFFRSVFHDWPDKYCVKILLALIPGLKPGARVVINDACMPPAGTLPPAANRVKRQWDLNMMLLFNGLDREETDWAHLFERADKRFKFLGVKTPTKNVEGVPPAFLLNIIEAVWEP
ncbi:O-methyltransferase gsfB [Lecanosticta acicola]|uniref:O-methyltransferase gsfB n=1 Tax=Lecanosticta acicola TaxID=111012 RepID=A0AAI8YU83_9PEZI|nr:O-methyltransferase gsfB [Lecanosticta acicola]